MWNNGGFVGPRALFVFVPSLSRPNGLDISPDMRCSRVSPLRLTAFGTLPLHAVQPSTSPSVSFAASSPARVRA